MTEPPRTNPPKAYVAYLILIVIAAAASLVALAVNSAEAHEAVSGFVYPGNCCSGIDCREVPESAISERPDGFHLPSGEIVGYHDTRIKDSPDGQTHWCSQGGSDTGRTICLFVPPRSY